MAYSISQMKKTYLMHMLMLHVLMPYQMYGNLDLEKLKQLQDKYLTKLIANCTSTKSNKTPYYLDEHDITYRKIRDAAINFI